MIPLSANVQRDALHGRRSARVGLRRSAAGRCPNVPGGRLFRAYLKIRPYCEVYAHDNGQYPADDARPYFTILIFGHLGIGPLLVFRWTWPTRLVLAILMPALTVLTFALLPIVKRAVIGVLWALRQSDHAEGSAP